MSSNIVAEPGQVFVCTACGKRSRDLYGNQALTRGWDASCILNSILCREDKLILDDNGYVTKIDDDGVISNKMTANVLEKVSEVF